MFFTFTLCSFTFDLKILLDYALLDTLIFIHNVKDENFRKMCKLSETVDDMEAYQKLTDSIVEHILWSTDDKLKESREILMQVQTRQLYKYVGYTRPPKDSGFKKKVIGKDIMKHPAQVWEAHSDP